MQGKRFEIVNTDCFLKLAEMPDDSIDLLLTDPPYGTTNLAFDRLKFDWVKWWSEINRVCRPHAVQVCFAAQPFATDLINANRKNFRYDLIWQKTQAVGFLSAKSRPLRGHELILVFCQKFGRHSAGQQASVYNPQMTAGTPYHHRARNRATKHYSAALNDREYQNEGTRYPTSVLTYARDAKGVHPTQKPQELCRWLVRSFSHSGQRVLDPFMGGGSSGVAALLEGREFVGMEMDPAYYAEAEQRLSVLTAV